MRVSGLEKIGTTQKARKYLLITSSIKTSTVRQFIIKYQKLILILKMSCIYMKHLDYGK